MFWNEVKNNGHTMHTFFLHVAVYIHVGSFFMDKFVYQDEQIFVFI